MTTTNVFSKLLAAYINPQTRVIVLRGGTRSGKTWAVLQLLNYIAEKSKSKSRTISVVSETMPHLKRGAIKDFKDMLSNENAFDANRWHDTDKYYRYKKAMLEFFSADQPSKVTGPARDILYMNECIYLDHEIYRQLSIRTREKVILDYNPAFESWVDEFIIPRNDGSVEVIDSTYLDNDCLSPSQIAEIESNKDIDPDWWAVYGLGLQGTKEGLVIKNWEICQALPDTFKKEYGGIDFGWSAPTAIMHLRLSEGDAYIKQLAYKSNMDNPAIAKAIKDAGLERMEWICDAAEPKSISELKALGINAVKSDSKDIKLGISILNRYRKFITADSLETIAEARQYRYEKLNTGKYSDIPKDANNHAWDPVRYIFLNRLAAIATPSLKASLRK